MYMSKEEFDAIKKRHETTILMDDDVGEAFAFVQELLEAEADALKEKCSYAVNSIRDMEKAAYEVLSMGQEIESGEFGGE